MKITLGRFAVTAIVFAVLTMLATGLANAQPPKCPNIITSCGCTIGAPGSYDVVNELFASDGLTLKSGCIDIEGQNISLILEAYIIGPGSDPGCSGDTPHLNSGVGIHVLPTASNVAISASGEYLCGWKYGVEIEGSKVNMYYVGTDNNNVGMFLNNATNNNCNDCDSEYNAVTGYQITGGSGNSFNYSFAYYNSQAGFWVDGSQGNLLNNNFAHYNGTGFYLGCSSKGQVKPQILCNKNTPTTGNNLVNNDAQRNQKYGIALEKGSINNTIDGNYTHGNTTKDMIDGNANCIYNSYLDDSFTTKSPSCID